MTPGIQPRTVKIKTITMEPHPLSITESGGKTIAKITLQMLINIKILFLLFKNKRVFSSIQKYK